MRRIFAVLSTLLLSVFLFSGCAAHQPAVNLPSGPQQAQLDSDMAVTLVSDFGSLDSHQAFCSGVWVSPTVIMTAGHCVEGYSHMKRRSNMIHALVQSGVPEEIAILVTALDPEEMDPADPDMPPMLLDMIKTMMTVPPVPEMGLDVPYIVPSQVVDNGASPTGFQHTSAFFIDHRADIALLKVTGFVPQHLSAKAAAHSPLVGEEVNSIGTVHGEYFAFRHETVAAYRHSEKHDGMKDIDGPFMQLSGSKISHGDSGSGVFNSRGQLVGITSFVDEGAGLGFCIHLNTIRGVLIGQRLMTGHIDVRAKDPDLQDGPFNLE